MRMLLVAIIVGLFSACSVAFKSNQFAWAKNAIMGDKRLAESKRWLLFYEGERHVAFAVQMHDSVRIVSLNHLEVDFVGTAVTAIRELSPVFVERTIGINRQGFVIQSGANKVNLTCAELNQYSDKVYIQTCRNERLNWLYQNELQVDEKREIVYVKTYYSPSKPPLEMYHGDFFETLKK